jgi:hypothetical protein
MSLVALLFAASEMGPTVSLPLWVLKYRGVPKNRRNQEVASQLHVKVFDRSCPCLAPHGITCMVRLECGFPTNGPMQRQAFVAASYSNLAGASMIGDSQLAGSYLYCSSSIAHIPVLDKKQSSNFEKANASEAQAERIDCFYMFPP